MIKIIRKVDKKELLTHLYDLDVNDSNLYKELNSGNYLGIFQFNGKTAEDIVGVVHPDNFSEAVAVNSLSRPGASSFTEQYAYNKHNPSHTTYPKAISQILEETYRVVLYQEQVMSVFNKIGGFTMEECLHGDEKIITDKGNISIKDIVEKKLDVKVLTLNEENFEYEWKNIINYFNNGKKDLIEIEFENGKKIKCTSNHLIFTKNRGWVEAGKLDEIDDIYSLDN